MWKFEIKNKMLVKVDQSNPIANCTLIIMNKSNANIKSTIAIANITRICNICSMTFLLFHRIRDSIKVWGIFRVHHAFLKSFEFPESLPNKQTMTLSYIQGAFLKNFGPNKETSGHDCLLGIKMNSAEEKILRKEIKNNFKSNKKIK